MSLSVANSEHIKVTPEMIDAGASILRDYAEMGPYMSKSFAEAVYKAMQVVAGLSSEKDHISVLME